MTTFVGNQADFSAALGELLELDYDAIEAYEEAIDRLEDNELKEKLTDFKKDHERHVIEISAILRKHNKEVPTGPSAKRWLTKGKVVLANLFGDNAILKAMLTNEEDTNLAYTRMNERSDKWLDAVDVIKNGLDDERRHKDELLLCIER